ncbi:MAG: hypothetical protein HYY50_04340 [Candidatus Kerfeldbacteria bacterium]|nr:hypothetical protein [Candidatus Kerfeldbacteria bacterium]
MSSLGTTTPLTPVLIGLLGVTAFLAVMNFAIQPGPGSSSLRFVDYRNKDYGFSFQYHGEWQPFVPTDKNDDRLLVLSPPHQRGEPIVAGQDELTVAVRPESLTQVEADEKRFLPSRTFTDLVVGGRTAKKSNVVQGIEDRLQEVLIDLRGQTLVIMAGGRHLQQLERLLGSFRFSRATRSGTNVNRRTREGCVVTGCSGQVCSDQEVVTTCEYREEYACYRTARCERQQNGECGWTATDKLQSCLGAIGPLPKAVG